MEEHIITALSEWRSRQSNTPELSNITTVDADLYPVPQRSLYYDSNAMMSGGDVKYVQTVLIKMDYDGVFATEIFNRTIF